MNRREMMRRTLGIGGAVYVGTSLGRGKPVQDDDIAVSKWRDERPPVLPPGDYKVFYKYVRTL